MIIEVVKKSAYGSDSFQPADVVQSKALFSLTGRKGLTQRDIQNLQQFSVSRVSVHLILGQSAYPLDISELPY